MKLQPLPRVFAVASPLLCALLASACDKSGAARGSSASAVEAAAAKAADQGGGAGLPPAAKDALDAGNAAFRAKRMEEALANYRAAAIAAPGHAAPWFGVYMVAGAMKNTALADSAMARVKALSQDQVALNAHARAATAPSAAATLPPGHPSMSPSPSATVTVPPLPSAHPPIQALPPGHPSPAKPQSL